MMDGIRLGRCHSDTTDDAVVIFGFWRKDGCHRDREREPSNDLLAYFTIGSIWGRLLCIAVATAFPFVFLSCHSCQTSLSFVSQIAGTWMAIQPPPPPPLLPINNERQRREKKRKKKMKSSSSALDRDSTSS